MNFGARRNTSKNNQDEWHSKKEAERTERARKAARVLTESKSLVRDEMVALLEDLELTHRRFQLAASGESAKREALKTFADRLTDHANRLRRSSQADPESHTLPNTSVFATLVLDTARRAPHHGWWSDDKIFISELSRELRSAGYAFDIQDLKSKLVAAHRAGQISMSRADLVAAMPQKDVDESETAYQNATFHFVKKTPAKEEGGDLEGAILNAYLHVTRGERNKYVRLAEIRPLLSLFDRGRIDKALAKMQTDGKAVLYPIDDPYRIKPEDNAAQLKVAGERRDLLLIRP